jgi:hypothetical protein
MGPGSLPQVTPTRAACARPGPGVTPFPDVIAPMPPSDSLPPSATALVPLACGLPRCGRLCCACEADDTCARHGSCVGDGSSALRHTGVYRGEARASQVTGPSSASVPWSNTPPDMVHSSPTTRRSPCCLQVNQDPGPPGRLEVAGPPAPWPTRSPAYASPRPVLTPAQGWLPARAGSPLAGQDSHLLDDTQSFMKALHPPVPIDPHCLVALICLSSEGGGEGTARVRLKAVPSALRALASL